MSIIVPIYNVEAYLRKCVDSLLCQDYEDYEIILVDDGSTDNSGIIADELSGGESLEDASLQVRGENKKIRVIHQENMGLSGARNTGILAARGEYVCFVDSDDYWEPNVLGKLMAQVEREDLDVLRFNYQNVRLVRGRAERYSLEDASLQVRGDMYEVFEPNKEPHKHDIRTDVVDGITYLNERMGYACYAVMYVVRRGLLIPTFSPHREEGEILFTENLHYEDVDWLPRMMLRAQRVNASQAVVYNYLMREGSITKVGVDKEKKRKNIEDQMRVIGTLNQLWNVYPQCDWLRNMRSEMASGVLNTVAKMFYEQRRAYIERLAAMQCFPLSISNQGKTYRRRAVLTNILGPNLYCILMQTTRKRRMV